MKFRIINEEKFLTVLPPNYTINKKKNCTICKKENRIKLNNKIFNNIISGEFRIMKPLGSYIWRRS